MYLICSIGPKINTIKDIEKLVASGMTTARFNFSHAQYNKIEKLIKDIKLNYPNIEIMQDLQGNKFRVSNRFPSEMYVRKGEKLIFCLEDTYLRRFRTSKYPIIPINYNGNFKDLLGAKEIFMKDATMHFKILKKDSKFIMAESLKDGIIRGEKGLNLPGVNREKLSIPEKDKRDIIWGLNKGVDIICISYVSSKRDVEIVKKHIKEYAFKKRLKVPKIWAKIECAEAINNFDDILSLVDGIMLGRGDLRAEVPYYEFPRVQEEIINKMKESQKPLVIATYVLDSCKKERLPSIGELNDIYMCIKEKVNGFMLAGEVGTSNNPSYSVGILNELIKKYST